MTKLIFMGTPSFSVEALKALCEAGHEIVGVYTQPPRPAGRGKKEKKSAVHLYAQEQNLPVYTPASFRKDPQALETFIELAHSQKVERAVVVAYGLLLPKEVLEAPAKGCWNIHASLLPRWRGAAPIQRAIQAGDEETGVCIMQMDEGLDTGPVLLRGTVQITDQTTGGSLHDALSVLGADLIVQALAQADQLVPISQDSEGACYATKLTKEESRLDFSKSACDLERQVRAFSPYPSCFFFCLLEGPKEDAKTERLKVLKVSVVEGTAKPGTLLGKDLTLACGRQALRLDLVQPAGKQPMTGRAFVNGRQLQEGCQLQEDQYISEEFGQS